MAHNSSHLLHVPSIAVCISGSFGNITLFSGKKSSHHLHKSPWVLTEELPDEANPPVCQHFPLLLRCAQSQATFFKTSTLRSLIPHLLRVLTTAETHTCSHFLLKATPGS